jgi:hypothetical protein
MPVGRVRAVRVRCVCGDDGVLAFGLRRAVFFVPFVGVMLPDAAMDVPTMCAVWQQSAT